VGYASTRILPAMDSGMVRIALVQVGLDDGEAAAARRERVWTWVAHSCEGADMVVLPELWVTGFFHFDRYPEEAEPLHGPFVEQAGTVARKLGCALHAGSFVERRPDGSLANTSVLLQPDGSVAAVYRKIHLFGFDSEEKRLLRPGRERVCAGAPPGTRARGLGRLGMATCYDVRFPEQFRELLDAGVETYVVPAAWPAARIEHWRLLTQARALENQAVFLGCNASGVCAGNRVGGRSLVCDPWGVVRALAGEGEQLLWAEVPMSAAAAARGLFPAVSDRGAADS